MLDRKVHGWNLVSKNLDSESEAPSELSAAGYNERINSEQIVLKMCIRDSAKTTHKSRPSE